MARQALCLDVSLSPCKCTAITVSTSLPIYLCVRTYAGQPVYLYIVLHLSIVLPVSVYVSFYPYSSYIEEFSRGNVSRERREKTSLLQSLARFAALVKRHATELLSLSQVTRDGRTSSIYPNSNNGNL